MKKAARVGHADRMIVWTKILLGVLLSASDFSCQETSASVKETTISFPFGNLIRSSSSNILLTAFSTFQDKKGIDRNITWYTSLSAENQDFVEEISGSVKCLNGISGQWVNLTIWPIPLSDKGLTKKANLIPIENGAAKTPEESLPALPPTAFLNTSGPSHCDAVEEFDSWNSLTIALTCSNVSDPDGIKSAELDAAKLENVANFTVRKHNCLRTRVAPSASNMLRMQWNQEAADQAQDWADQCSYNHNNETNRTTSQFACGQNLAYTSPWPFSWNSVINMWFNEFHDYKYGQPNDLHTIGHYTAMTWATTFQLGCAYKDCGGWHFYVCHYCPSGNFGDLSAPYKAGNPCEACPNSCDRGLCTNSCAHSNIYSNCDELERKYKICSSRFQERLAVNCKATCLCPGSIYL